LASVRPHDSRRVQQVNMPSLPIFSIVKQSISQLRQRIANRELCYQCRVILRGFKTSNESDSTTSIQQISMSFKSIETSAAKGCPLCLLFLDGMPSDDRTSLQEQEGRYLSELRSTSGGTVDLGGNKWQVALFENPNVLTYRSPKPRTPPGRYIFKNIHLAPLKGSLSPARMTTNPGSDCQ
jgi:hypothetical protein